MDGRFGECGDALCNGDQKRRKTRMSDYTFYKNKRMMSLLNWERAGRDVRDVLR